VLQIEGRASIFMMAVETLGTAVAEVNLGIINTCVNALEIDNFQSGDVREKYIAE